MGKVESSFKISSIGRLRLMIGASSASALSSAGAKRAGSYSSCSRKTPSGVILARILRSAEQETPRPTGQLAA